MLLHAAKRAAPTAHHVEAALGKGRRAIRRGHVDDFHGGDIDAEMFHLLEEAVVSGGPDRDADLLALKFLGAVLGDLQFSLDHAVVVVVVNNGNVGNLQVLAGGCGNHEGRHALTDRNMDIA